MKKTFILTGILIALSLTITHSPYSEVTYAKEMLNASHLAPSVSIINETDIQYANNLKRLSLTLHPGTTFKKQSKATTQDEVKCKSVVYQALMVLPEDHRDHLNNLTLYFADGRRGLGGGSTIILRCSEVNDKELMSVLVHEMGHVVDTGLYTGNPWKGKSVYKDGNTPIYNDDISIRFYRISWKNSDDLKDKAKETDFVSRYSMSDPFEDFAETYNYYILHGPEFRELAKYNRSLELKYLFMKYYVFHGKEFELANDDEISVNYIGRPYDTTVLDYDLVSFLDN